MKKANREWLAYRYWWWGGSGHQTLYISRLGEVRTGAGSSGLGRYAVSSIRAMNQFF
jgi:hypothetical protein